MIIIIALFKNQCYKVLHKGRKIEQWLLIHQLFKRKPTEASKRERDILTTLCNNLENKSV